MKKERKIKTRSGFVIVLVAAAVLEAISCLMYFTSRAAIKQESEERAKTELRKAELEIEMHTIEMETAAKTLSLLMEKHIDDPNAAYADTRLAVSSLRENTSLAVAYIPDYFPKKGRYYEICSTRISPDSIHTRQIGSAEHDYTQMEWFQNGFVHDSCWWCEPYLDDSGSETFVVSCSYPVCDKEGRIVAVVCVDLSLEFLKTKLPNYLQVYPNSYYSIKSSKGEDIVRVMDTLPGKKYNLFEEEIDATGWHIEIVIPEEELFSDLNRIGRIVGLLMFLGLVILILLVVHSVRTVRKMLDFAEKNQRIEGELEIAQTIQMAMLPKVFPPFMDRLDLNIHGMLRPAKEVGGDLYDFYVRDNKLLFCIGDVSGKGVPAALVMATARSLFRSISVHEEDAGRIVSMLNDAMTESNEQNMFVTLFLGILDLKTGEMNYCNAGHNAPVLVESLKFKVESLEVLPNLPLGIEPGFPFRTQHTKMQYGDTLFLYTDGLTEAENKNHEQFGDERMMKVLSEPRTERPQQLILSMEQAVDSFVGEAQQSDDLTMCAIRYQIPALIMRNDIQQIPTLAEWIEGLEIPTELNMPVNLALEEAVTNVMLYAYPGRNDGKVFVEFQRVNNGKQLIFTISDSGIPFDPTAAPEADTTLSAEERQIGGLGIHLVRQLMDEVRYERIDDKNILTLVKTLNC